LHPESVIDPARLRVRRRDSLCVRGEETHVAENPDPQRPFTTHWDASAREAAPGAWAERRRLAEAMRRVIALLVRSDAPEAELRTAADRLEQYAAHLATHPRNPRYEGFAESSPSGDVGAFFDQSPIIGRANPLAPPLSLEASPDGQRALGRAVFGDPYEGPPGCVHGGWVAAAFDEVLGFAQSLGGSPGMTGTLTIRYRKPTPLNTELRFEAWLERSEGRKRFVRGTLSAGGELKAEAEGIFIAIDPSRFQSLLAERSRRGAP
jgi:acyl-coenzyme A thioesterase PaaI-like protein